MARCDRFPLPRSWTKTIRSSVLHAVSLAAAALTSARGRAARNRRPRVQLVAELERAKTEIGLFSLSAEARGGIPRLHPVKNH